MRQMRVLGLYMYSSLLWYLYLRIKSDLICDLLIGPRKKSCDFGTARDVLENDRDRRLCGWTWTM